MTNLTETPCITPVEPLSASSFHRRMAWEGAGWKLLSCAIFAAINGVVRYLGGGGAFVPETPIPANVMMFFQNVFGALFLLPILFRQSGIQHLLPRSHYQMHFFRVFTAVAGIGLWYLTLQKMPIAAGVALTFTGPVFTVVGAKLLLGETVGGRRCIAILLTLIGAFIISRPDHALFGKGTTLGLAVLLPLGSAIALALSKLLTRQLAQKGETAESLATYLLLLMAPVSLFLALPEWVTPELTHWPWLILLGLLAAGAHLTFGKAYAKAEVIFLTPFGFSKFLFSTLIGYYCFLEIPSSSLWLGMLIIAVAILFLSYKKPGNKSATREPLSSTL